MLRYSLALAIISASALLPAAQPRTSPFSPGFEPTKGQTKGPNLPHLRRLIEEKKWSEVSALVKEEARKESISLKDLQTLSLSFEGTPFFSAVLATKNILFLHEKTGLSLGVVFPIALFAQTTLKNEVASGRLFWPSKEFGRELQYDKKNEHLFIHLGTNGVKPVGIGRMKVVTKTILFDTLHPEVMARGVSEAGCKREMYAMKHLRGLPNVLEAQALLHHKDEKTGKYLATVITKIIRPGCLQNILDNKSWKLTLKERVKIACDIMCGISGMQERKFVHCDLGARNYFVNIEGDKPGHRKITAYVADFGRTIPIRNAKDSPVQGNSRYAPPEAIFREKMHGRQYFQSDLFAVGCVFWRLYFGDLPPWAIPDREKNSSMTRKEQYQAKVYHINVIHNHVAAKMKSVSKNKHTPTLKEGFLRIIIQMTKPMPSDRGSAEVIYKDLYGLLYGKAPDDNGKASDDNSSSGKHKRTDKKDTQHHSNPKK